MRRMIVLIGVMLLVIGIVAILFSLIPIPFATKEPYDIPQSSNLFHESFVVPVGETHRTASLQNGDFIHIEFTVTSGGNLDVDFYVLDELNYFKWVAQESYSAQVSLSRVTNCDQDFIVPHNATWCFVWDNSFSWITQKGVTTTISKHWNEVAYRDVTDYHTIIPTDYASYVEYVGIGFVVVGALVIVWGAISEAKKPEK
jgi:hypothetical protein